MQITRRARALVRRDKAPECAWEGREHTIPAVVTVDIDKDCGHALSRATPTCIHHLNGLVATSGVAVEPTPCPACGVTSRARIVATHDLPAEDNSA